MQSRLPLLAAAFLWSTAGAAMKICQLSGWQIAGGRALVAGVFLFLAVRSARRLPNLPVLATAVGYAATVILFADQQADHGGQRHLHSVHRAALDRPALAAAARRAPIAY